MNFLAKRYGVLYDLKQMMKQALRNTKIKIFFAGLAIIVGGMASYEVTYAARDCNSFVSDSDKNACKKYKDEIKKCSSELLIKATNDGITACHNGKCTPEEIADCEKAVREEFSDIVKKINPSQSTSQNSSQGNSSQKPATPNIPTGPCGPGTSLIKCDGNQDPISYLIKTVINFLTTLIFVIAPLMLVVAGVVYATAADSAERVNLAKTIIKNVIIGVVLYVLLTIILHFLVPGGVI